MEYMRMDQRGKFTLEEIISQPESWNQVASVVKEHQQRFYELSRSGNYQQIIFTGCGSTYYLSLAAAALFQEMTGLTSRGLPASELWLSPGSFYNSTVRILLVAISRSGETSETLHACEHFRSINSGSILTLVCKPDSVLSSLGDMNIVFPSGMEKSIAQTRAFSTLYLGVVGIGAVWSGRADRLDRYPLITTSGNHLIKNYQEKAAKYGNNLELERVYFLGSGARYGLACELNLKMKEMSLTHSEAFHFLEFRHGPKAMINSKTLIIGLVSEQNSTHEMAVLNDMRSLGAEIITIGENNVDIPFNSGLEEVMRNVLYLPFGQMMAYERSIAKGLDPDHPNNLDPVVRLA
jgi:glutamine---fructose-6-phosphate transaminase (isomerizing)